jgi:MSHA biogenesis protein MshO
MKKPEISKGFTLIELVLVIVITGVIAAFLSEIISRPIQGFIDISTRATLVDAAELALRRMSREIRLALPNSVRIRSNATTGLQSCSATGGTVCSVEILRTLTGGRYRNNPDGSNTDECTNPGDNDRLRFSSTNDCFEIMGVLGSTPVDGGAAQSDCLDGTVDCMVIYNTGQSAADAYQGTNIAAIADNDPDGDTLMDSLTFIGAPPFPVKSPRQRFHIVDMPVSFVCDTNADTITRQADYTITNTQALNPGGNQNSILANKILSCAFTYNQGSSSRNGLLTMEIVLFDTDTLGNTNTVRLMRQIQVSNVP